MKVRPYTRESNEKDKSMVRWEKTHILFQFCYISGVSWITLLGKWENLEKNKKKKNKKEMKWKTCCTIKLIFIFSFFIWTYLENRKQENDSVKISYTRKFWFHGKYIWSFCRIQKNSTKQPRPWELKINEITEKFITTAINKERNERDREILDYLID